MAQAGSSAAIGLAYSRRNVPWLLISLAAAAVVYVLARLVRNGGHTAWLVAITIESALVAVGLFRFAYAGYLGGTLLAIIALGTLLHPSVARAFALAPSLRTPAHDHSGRAEGPGDVLQDGVAS